MKFLPDEKFLTTDTSTERDEKISKIQNRVRNWYIKRHGALLILCFDQFRYFDDQGNRMYFYHQKAIINIVSIETNSFIIRLLNEKNSKTGEVTCLWETKDSLPKPTITSVTENGFIGKINYPINYSTEEAINMMKDYNLCFSEGLNLKELNQIL